MWILTAQGLNKILIMLLLVFMLLALYQQRIISISQTRIDNYRTFILLHAYKQNSVEIKCKKCKYKNVIPLYSDTSIFKYAHEIKALYPTLLPTN